MTDPRAEIAQIRSRLAELEALAAEQRPDAAEPEVDVDEVIRRAGAQGRGTGIASRMSSKEKE